VGSAEDAADRFDVGDVVAIEPAGAPETTKPRLRTPVGALT
jgi:hypothetical protein